MKRFKLLVRDRKGAAAVEFALAVPVLMSMVWGLFQVAMVYQANAGMQHALGEAARYATVWPTPTDTQIQAKITSAKFGLGNGTWGTPQIATNPTAHTKTITVTFSQPTDFIFFRGPTVSMTATKVVYLAT